VVVNISIITGIYLSEEILNILCYSERRRHLLPQFLNFRLDFSWIAKDEIKEVRIDGIEAVAETDNGRGDIQRIEFTLARNILDELASTILDYQLTPSTSVMMHPCQLIIVSPIFLPYAHNSCIAWARIVSSFRTSKPASDSYLAQSDDAQISRAGLLDGSNWCNAKG
jgi:hypothetical protein